MSGAHFGAPAMAHMYQLLVQHQQKEGWKGGLAQQEGCKEGLAQQEERAKHQAVEREVQRKHKQKGWGKTPQRKKGSQEQDQEGTQQQGKQGQRQGRGGLVQWVGNSHLHC